MWLYGQQCWDWVRLVGGPAPDTGVVSGLGPEPGSVTTTGPPAPQQTRSGRGSGGPGRSPFTGADLRADRMPPVAGSGPGASGSGSGSVSGVGSGNGRARARGARAAPAPGYTGGADLAGASVSGAAWDGPAVNRTLQDALSQDPDLLSGAGMDPEDDGQGPSLPPPIASKKSNAGVDLERRLQEFSAQREHMGPPAAMAR